MAEYDGPEITGVFIRVLIPDVGWCAADMADPAIPEDQLDAILAGWGEEKKDYTIKFLLGFAAEVYRMAASANPQPGDDGG